MWKIYVFDTISLWQDMRHPQKGSMKRFSFTWRIALELFSLWMRIYEKLPPSACRSKKRAKLLSRLGLISLDQDFPFCSQVNTGMCASQHPRALFSSTIIQISGAFFISFNGYIMRMKDVKRDTVELREHWSVIDICRGIRNHHILAHLHITCFMETRQRSPREKATLFYCCMLLSTVPMVRISITPSCRTSFYFVVHRKKTGNLSRSS